MRASENLAVLQDLLHGLPPRAAVALTLTAQAIEVHGALFLGLLNKPARLSIFDRGDLAIWIWAGLVSIGRQPTVGGIGGHSFRAIVWIEPGSVGDFCIGLLRHNAMMDFDPNKSQFPGIDLPKSIKVADGVHPCSYRGIREDRRCGDCALLVAGSYCNLAKLKNPYASSRNVSPRWPGCDAFVGRENANS